LVSLVARLTSIPDDSSAADSFRTGSVDDGWQLVPMRPGSFNELGAWVGTFESCDIRVELGSRSAVE
jgi:hypothetical protein